MVPPAFPYQTIMRYFPYQKLRYWYQTSFKNLKPKLTPSFLQVHKHLASLSRPFIHTFQAFGRWTELAKHYVEFWRYLKISLYFALWVWISSEIDSSKLILECILNHSELFCLWDRAALNPPKSWQSPVTSLISLLWAHSNLIFHIVTA